MPLSASFALVDEEIEYPVEPINDLLRGRGLKAGSSKLKGQGNAIEVTTDRRDGRGVLFRELEARPLLGTQFK